MTPFGGGLFDETGREGGIHREFRFDPFPAPGGWAYGLIFIFCGLVKDAYVLLRLDRMTPLSQFQEGPEPLPDKHGYPAAYHRIPSHPKSGPWILEARVPSRQSFRGLGTETWGVRDRQLTRSAR